MTVDGNFEEQRMESESGYTLSILNHATCEHRIDSVTYSTRQIAHVAAQNRAESLGTGYSVLVHPDGRTYYTIDPVYGCVERRSRLRMPEAS
ncbi:MAG: hypothetical protein VYE22_23435 [Myxococcota bacterium]|nr:hypothetical protein [Myxococcota bacterium]